MTLEIEVVTKLSFDSPIKFQCQLSPPYNTMKTIFTKPCILVSVFISFLELSLITTFSSAQSYRPVEHITLACGSSIDTTGLDGRNWTADTNNKFLVADKNTINSIPSITTTQASQLPDDIVDQAPYRTARLSRSEFTYLFPVTSGPKFLRLYFYPFSYPGFNSSDAFFSVKANGFTLVNNYSAEIHAIAYGSTAFYREFCLVIQDGQRLNITFRPSSGMPDAYAFVNAIEIVSMPAYLYYSSDAIYNKWPDNVDTFSKRFYLDNNTAMELMYRLNMGGRSLTPQEDTGMFRYWYDDTEYLTVDLSSTLPSNTSIQLNLTEVGNYTAPVNVYKTGRSMGTNKTINDNYGLTWEFKVDSSFTYLVRLHFCEIQPPIQQVGDRVFEIRIANLSAEGHADVIKWSGGNGIPVYRDYTVSMTPEGNEKVQNLSVALRTVSWRLTVYSDAILNGLEMFKLSDLTNLAAPNPDIVLKPSVSTPPQKSTKPKSGVKEMQIIASVVGGFVALCLLLLFFIFRQKLKVKDSSSKWRSLYSFSTTKTSKSLPTDLCRRFSLAEIKAATNNFDDVLIIGKGGFGNVFKGFINDGSTTVAIKRLNPQSRQGAIEFRTEIQMLSQLRHLNLVSLIGYCYEEDEMVLVYDYVARGTFRDHLYKTDNPPLSWNQRLQICMGAARGLLYLHSGVAQTIIHRDVKTTNILLDEKWVAKVSDFGLSKIGPTNMAGSHVSTAVKGSFGYLDPEYFRFQRLTVKSDVYSFGVVLCEVLCARPPIDRSVQPIGLAEWVRQSYQKGKLNDVVDPYLKGKIPRNCLSKFIELTMNCLSNNGVDRPSMSDVVWGLEFALQLQESAEKQLIGSDGEIEMGVSEMESQISSVDDNDDLCSSSNGLVTDSTTSGTTITSSSKDQSVVSYDSSAVLSDIMNLHGR